MADSSARGAATPTALPSHVLAQQRSATTHLQYRLFVEVTSPRPAVEKLALEQLHSWLRHKGLDADALGLEAETALGPNTVGALTVSERGNGLRAVRAVISETNPAGQWTTTMTVAVSDHPKVAPWLWLDLHGPESVTARIPGLARQLLDVFEASAHNVRHGEALPVHTEHDIAQLVDAVCDPHRRTLLFVAGSDPRMSYDQWLGHVRELLRDTVGLAGGYVLTPSATEAFNNAVGPAHQVLPYTVRTFRPGVLPDDHDDARRHKTLGIKRILDDPVRSLAPMLGRRAREVALQTPLPTEATAVDRAFARLANARLLARLDDATTSAPTLSPDIPPPHPPAAIPDQSTAAPASEPATPSVTTPLGPELVQALELVLGQEPTVENVLELGDLAELARRAQASRTAISDRLDAYEADNLDLRTQLDELRTRVEDAQLAAGIAEDDRARAEAETRRLRQRLASSGQAEHLWSTHDEATEPADQRPSTYVELVERLDEWRHLTVTGELEHLLELDQYDEANTWAGKIWDVLAALNDYVEAIREGFSGGVHQYLSTTPPGRRGYPAGRHAADESDDVRNNSQFRAQRVLPVPHAVNPDGTVFMGAHFKIAQFGMISPRLHYHPDVRGTGRIYIGYIGRHLRTQKTN